MPDTAVDIKAAQRWLKRLGVLPEHEAQKALCLRALDHRASLEWSCPACGRRCGAGDHCAVCVSGKEVKS